MNHPSEWAKFFDKKTERYRYKHKGLGVIRDTFMNIGKVFKNNENNVAKKTTEKATKTIAEKASQRVEKGSKQIRKILQELKNQILLKKVRNKCEKKENRCLKIRKRNLQCFNQAQKNIRRSLVIKSNFDKILINEKNFFFFFI